MSPYCGYGKLVVFSELQDIAGTIGTLDGGSSLASEDSKTFGERRLSTKNGGLDGGT